MTSSAKVDRAELETKVQDMYRAVALHPEGEFHFEMGRTLAERLGYSPDARRPSRILRHRHRGAATGRNRLQLDAVGRLHRRSDAAGRLPLGNRGSGFKIRTVRTI